MYLGNNILMIRTHWKESQEVFGRRFGVGRSLVSKWEGGESDPGVTVLVQLEELSGVPFARLVSERLGPEDLPSYPRQKEEWSSVARDPEEGQMPIPKTPSPASTSSEELLEAIKALRIAIEAEREIAANERAENARLRKEFEMMKKRVELMDAELLRLAGKRR
jgi:transcriptional regulator with XRE-family HTH domain